MTRRRYAPMTVGAMLILALAAGTGTLLTSTPRQPVSGPMLRAALHAADAFSVIRRARRARGVIVDPVTDPNRTGLIGVEWSPITTTFGFLSAKRTSTNPNMAAALVIWLHEAAVSEGSAVAVGASGSFPALVVEVTAALQALGAQALVISSAAASSWGANDPAFTWLDMESALVQARLAPRSIAASPGGANDAGAGLASEAHALLIRAIARAGIPMIEGRTLRERVAARIAAYERAAGGRPIAAFVNVGGAAANVGTCLELVYVPPGVHRTLPRCQGEPGVMWIMSARGVPVVHLLHVEGIARSFGLPIDPVPLPHPGAGAPFSAPSTGVSAALLAGFVAAMALIVRRADAHRRARSAPPARGETQA